MFLVLANSKKLILNHLEGKTYLLECLGFIVNIEMNPGHVIVFLGLTIDPTNMELRQDKTIFSEGLKPNEQDN